MTMREPMEGKKLIAKALGSDDLDTDPSSAGSLLSHLVQWT